MQNDPLDKRGDALSFLIANQSGVLATISAAGEPSARLVYYTCDDSFNIYFLTLANTRKAADLKANPRAAFVVSETETPRTIQIEGTVEDLTDTATVDPLLADFVNSLLSHKTYGIPLTHFDESTLKFFKLSPKWIRWGNFTYEYGSDSVFTEISSKESA